MSLANHQYDAIMREYNQKQFKNKNIADRHYQEVCEKIPEFSTLQKEEADTALFYGKQILEGNPDASAGLDAALNNIVGKRKSLLKAHGYPEDYLDIKFDCNICQDTGYTNNNEQCSCFRKAAIDLLYSQSQRLDLYKKENFSTFSLDYYSDKKIDPKSNRTMREMARDAFRLCKVFTDSIDISHGNLLIVGPTGVGKSFLANCVAKELIDSIHSVIHLDAPTFFKNLADYHFGKTDEDMETFSLYNCDCLIVDDLGAELLNSLVVSSLWECIEHRRLARKSTVFTTNLTLEEIQEKYNDRTFSRLISDYTYIRLDGDDIRFIKKTL